MTRTTAQIEIERPVHEVFTWLDESEKALQWLEGLEEIVPLTEGGNRVGARATHVYVENGRRFEMIEEIVAYEPDRHVKIRGESEAFRMSAEYTLTPKGDVTLLEVTSESRFTSGLMRVIAPLVAGFSKRRLMNQLNTLKSLVESA